MKKFVFYSLLASYLTLSSCYKDLGNYDYVYPEDPIVMGIEDSVFAAYTGDSLIIKPTIKHSLANTPTFSYEWTVFNPEDLKEKRYEGMNLRILFDQRPGTYLGQYTVTNHANGMKYFYSFSIQGRTEFTKGTVVLSVEAGVTQLTFIKPDNTIRPRLYEGLHDGEHLPSKPIQLLHVYNTQQSGFGEDNYWVVCAEGDKPAVIIDANTMKRKRYINDNFFTTPPTVKPGSLKATPNGVTTGIINGKLYVGTTSTAPFNPAYGTYGNFAVGDYDLAPYFLYEPNQYYLGFNTKKKQFVRFNGAGIYFGTDYTTVKVGKGFDPTKVGIDLLYMQYLNNDVSFAYGQDASGKIYELRFSFSGEQFLTEYMREFAGASLIKTNTKWIASSRETIYFTSADKIYRYYPINQEVKPLVTDFGGKDVSMLKLSVTGDTLISGAEGALYYLNVGTGKNGEVISKIEGIPGAPIDVVMKK